MQTPSVHLAVQSSLCQSPFVAVRLAVCGINSLCVMCLILGERVVSTKRYTWVTYIRACSCLVNSEHNPNVVIHYGVKYKCLRVQCDMLWCENECSYEPCDMPWCENERSYVPCDMPWCENECSHMLYDMIWCDKWMFACSTQNALVWKWMFACTHMICSGVQNVCSHILYNTI